ARPPWAPAHRRGSARSTPPRARRNRTDTLPPPLLLGPRRRRPRRHAARARVLVELAVERLAIETEPLRSARLVAGFVLEHALDELALELGERHPPRDRGPQKIRRPLLAHLL